MLKQCSMAEARRDLSRMPSQFVEMPELSAIKVTRRGQPILAVIDWDKYSAIIQTLEILSDEEQSEQLRHAVVQLGRNETVQFFSTDSDTR